MNHEPRKLRERGDGGRGVPLRPIACFASQSSNWAQAAKNLEGPSCTRPGLGTASFPMVPRVSHLPPLPRGLQHGLPGGPGALHRAAQTPPPRMHPFSGVPKQKHRQYDHKAGKAGHEADQQESPCADPLLLGRAEPAQAVPRGIRIHIRERTAQLLSSSVWTVGPKRHHGPYATSTSYKWPGWVRSKAEKRGRLRPVHHRARAATAPGAASGARPDSARTGLRA